MIPKFWKLSHGSDHFNFEAIMDALGDEKVYVHKDTLGMATSSTKQGEDFVNAPIGDYFYLTHGNQGVYALGQFTGPANIFSNMRDGWLDRPFRLIKHSISKDTYSGPQKWWTPNFNSTFVPVPGGEISLFEDLILKPYFDISLRDF